MSALAEEPVTEALSARNVSKSFGNVHALKQASLVVRPGEVHALVGQNGAGKSTLVKIVCGALTPDEGEIAVAGVPVTALTPGSARARGISVIHQERQIAMDLTVTENVMLGRMPTTPWGAIDWSKARREAKRTLLEVGLDLDPGQPVRRLAVGQLQGIEIARALLGDPSLIVMDEPTSAISGSEVQRLFEILRTVRSKGHAVLYISHHLEEIFEIADTVSVLRDGQLVASRPVAGLDTTQLVSLMLGRDPDTLAEQVAAESSVDRGEPVIDAEELVCEPTLRGVSLDVCRGEIVCVTGAVGSGRRELARCLAGVQRPTSGSVRVNGVELVGPRQAVRAGVVFVPEDRKREGVLLQLPVLENLVLGELATNNKPWLRSRRRSRAKDWVRQLSIRTSSVDTPVRNLSGGNQQKVLMGRWLNIDANVLIFDEPTAGIDVGSKVEIYQLLRQMAAEGATIVIFSSDFEEIKLMADRVVVLRRGQVSGVLPREAISDERLLALELGGVR